MTSHYDKLVYVDGFIVTRLQTANWDQEITDEDIEEMGNSGIVETIIDPVIPVTVTMNTNDWGATDFMAQIMGSEADVDSGSAYNTAAADQNSWIVNSSDMKVQKVDVTARIRSGVTGKQDRTVWIPNCGITSLNWSYSVDGNASENVTLRGDTDRHFIGEFRDANVEIGAYATSSTFTITSTVTTHTVLYISINNTIYDDTNFTFATSTVTVIGDLATTLVDGDRFRAFIYKTTASDTFTELDTSDVGAIKSPYVVIGLGDADQIAALEKTLRLQSVDVTASVTREDIKEIGTEDLVNSSMAKHEVVVDATVLEDSLENFAYMLGVTPSEWTNRDTVGVEMRLQDSIGNLQELYVQVYDDSTQAELLKTLHCTSLRLTSSPFSHDVGGQGQYSLSFKCDNWSWAGEGVSGNRLANAYPNLWIET